MQLSLHHSHILQEFFMIEFTTFSSMYFKICLWLYVCLDLSCACLL
jgi:hypothetical protein